jgi:hypothetical protein
VRDRAKGFIDISCREVIARCHGLNGVTLVEGFHKEACLQLYR